MPEADTPQNYYAHLKVSPTASENEIKNAYRDLALEYHPDRHPGQQAEYTEKFQIIQAAYEILCNSGKRQTYDNERQGHPSLSVPGNTSSFYSRAPPPPCQSGYSRAPPQESPPYQYKNGIFRNPSTARGRYNEHTDKEAARKRPHAASSQSEQNIATSTQASSASRYDLNLSDQGFEKQARSAPTSAPNPHQFPPPKKSPTINIPNNEGTEQSDSAQGSSKFTPKNLSADRGQQQGNSYCVGGNDPKDFPPPKNSHPLHTPTESQSKFAGSESKHVRPEFAQRTYQASVQDVPDYEGDPMDIDPLEVPSAVPPVGVNRSTQLPPASTQDPTFPPFPLPLPLPPEAPTDSPVLVDIYLQQFRRYVLDWQAAMCRMNLCSRLQPMEPESLPPRFCHDLSETGSTIGFESYYAKMREQKQVLKTWQEWVVEHLEALKVCETVRRASAKFLSDLKDREVPGL